MSGDHNQNQSDSGWRKRQIALDIKAKNARELGLDYEPNIMEMAREAGFEGCAELTWEGVICTEELERFAELVRADEREKFLAVLRQLHDSYSLASNTSKLKEKT